MDLKRYYFAAKFRNDTIQKFLRIYSKHHPLISSSACIHYRESLSDLKIPCPLPHCEAQVEQWEEFKQHIKSAHCLLYCDYQYQCKCGKIFNTVKLVQKHFKENHTENMFCKRCGKTYEGIERYIEAYKDYLFKTILKGMSISKRGIG